MIKIKIIDESSTQHPFPKLINQGVGPGGVSSNEGYFHNDSKISNAMLVLANVIGLKTNDKTLDVGYGTNTTVSKALNRIGMDTSGIDPSNSESQNTNSNSLPHLVSADAEFKEYCGTIERMHDSGSELKNKKFNLIIFWGSWISGGQNFTVAGEVMELRLMREGQYSKQKMEQERLKIIQICKKSLVKNGGVLIVSPRYARHGAGFSLDQLPHEKQISLKLANQLHSLGAKELIFFGLSKNFVEQQINKMDFSEQTQQLFKLRRMFGVERNIEPVIREITETVEKTKKMLKDDNFLFSDLSRQILPLSIQELKEIKKMKIDLGRIDAMYARF